MSAIPRLLRSALRTASLPRRAQRIRSTTLAAAALSLLLPFSRAATAPAPTAVAPAAAPLDLGTRWELFVDEFLVASKSGAALRLHAPVRREIVLTTDQPWEGPTQCCPTKVVWGVRKQFILKDAT
jgi:hypothetical protein